MLAVAVIGLGMLAVVRADAWAAGAALSDKPIPMAKEEDLPPRTPPIIEIGPAFLGRGNLDPGIELPTGAVWQPALWVFGDFRTSLNYFDNQSGNEVEEWANRLDVFFNAQMTPTERLLLGVSPLREDGEFSGYTINPGEDRWDNHLNFDITTLFIEGEFGEIFPNLDPEDTGAYDIGFSIGRQPLFFQEGMMLNDTVDAIGITRDTIVIPGISPDLRVTALFGWNQIHRDDNRNDEDALLFGLFSEADLRRSTVNFDLAFVDGDSQTGGDGFYVGAAAIQRIWLINTAFRINSSFALDDETDAVSDGTLLFAEGSFTPFGTEDVAYLNLFAGIDNYSSAARDPTAGGPLGRTGILFAAVGLGRYGAALGNRADDAIGGSIGYQKFFNHQRTQLVLEIGGRVGTADTTTDAVAIGARLQHAIGRRYLIQIDGFIADEENRDLGSGLRSEFLVRF